MMRGLKDPPLGRLTVRHHGELLRDLPDELYLTLPGSTLASSSRSLVVRRGGQERAQVPVLGLERVVVLAPSHLTSAALALCAEERVELVAVGHGARVMARLGVSPAGDVADDGRRERVARVLEDYCVRVRYSVFECVLGGAEYRQLRRALAPRIDPAEDAVAFYRLCRGCGGRVRRLGCPPPDADPQYLIL